LNVNDDGSGYQPYELPVELKYILFSNRMHLDEYLVAKIVNSLQSWLNNGELSGSQSFGDIYMNSCSIYENVFSNILLGNIDANPIILCSEARNYNLDVIGGTGWQPYVMPEGVKVDT